ncbi:MAG: UbiX family flavin prenyltransferase [Pseudomonadota bacterium]|nr:UbiX family flavin prenyltransferase [Pseudomonadota bacterium]
MSSEIAAGSEQPPRRRLVVAVTGASGALLGLRLLQLMQGVPEWETHLVLSPAAVVTAQQELEVGRDRFQQLATCVYGHKDIGAAIASGSFRTEGMVVIPCSMKTLSGIAHGSSDNLVTRAADVTLKERRRLVLVTREAPLNLIQLRNMVAVTEAGGIIFPPAPAFYLGLQDLDAVVTQIVGRVLDQFGVHLPVVERWRGLKPAAPGAL